jgi:hypothetical protein
MHKPLMIAPECLVVPCISKSYMPSCFIDQVDFIVPKLVVHGFII